MSALSMQLIASAALASGTSTLSAIPSSTYTSDPILEYKPNFALSMPVQVLFIGVVLTLMGVLLGHLIFTAQYHWPLARTNFILQVASVVALLISQLVLLQVVFHESKERSSTWPYMFVYLAVDVPPFNWAQTSATWSTGSIAGWQLLAAVTSGFIQLTHIQFLTMLYPSRLERYLILAILAPFAIASSAMELVPIDKSDPTSVVQIADIINNVSDATLALIFMGALFLWGLVVNRQRAWRMDGGTAAFGVGACILAFTSTVVEFVYLPRRNQYAWMPNLVLATLCWQNFLGLWWWVGAAGAGMPAEELVRKLEKRRRKDEKRATRRQERSDAARERWQSLLSVFEWPWAKAAPTPTAESPTGEEDLAVVERASGREGETSSTAPPSLHSRRRQSQEDGASQTTESSVLSTETWYMRWFHRLRQAHRHAARRQAVEHNTRVAQAYGPAAAEGEAPMGWGLGSYGAREIVARRDETEAGRHSGEYASLEGEPVSKPAETPSGLWWWGPLRRWRLQDSTSYR